MHERNAHKLPDYLASAYATLCFDHRRTIWLIARTPTCGSSHAFTQAHLTAKWGFSFWLMGSFKPQSASMSPRVRDRHLVKDRLNCCSNYNTPLLIAPQTCSGPAFSGLFIASWSLAAIWLRVCRFFNCLGACRPLFVARLESGPLQPQEFSR